MRGSKRIMAPETACGCTGDGGDVVFPCGYTIAHDDDTIYLYHGAASMSIALATGSVRGLPGWLKENGGPADANTV